MSYRDPASGRFAPRPVTPSPCQPRHYYRVAVERGRETVPRGPWREHSRDAMQDAIDRDLASYDRSQREYFLAVPVTIQSCEAFDRPADPPGIH